MLSCPLKMTGYQGFDTMNKPHFRYSCLMSNKIVTNVYCALLTLLSAVTACQPAIASPQLQDFNVVYTFSRNGMNVGEVKRSLRTSNDGRYIFESVSEATGFISLFVRDKIVERSTWTYTSNRPQPLEYLYRRNGGKKERHVKLSFDWKEAIVTNTINNDPWKMHIPEGAQDKLLYQLTLMVDLMAGKEKLHYEIADGGVLKDYELVITGEEKVNTPIGTFDAIKIQRVDDKRNTIIWCAKALNYLPVRIKQDEKDDAELTMQIRSVTGLPITNAPTSTVSIPE